MSCGFLPCPRRSLRLHGDLPAFGLGVQAHITPSACSSVFLDVSIMWFREALQHRRKYSWRCGGGCCRLSHGLEGVFTSRMLYVFGWGVRLGISGGSA